MPGAICPKCGNVQQWRNTRGASLKSLVCGKCGEGGLKKAVFNDDTEQWEPYTPAGQRGRLIACSLCRRKRREKGPYLRELVNPEIYYIAFGPYNNLRVKAIWMDAGARLCNNHDAEHSKDFPVIVSERVFNSHRGVIVAARPGAAEG